ncbi:MAG: carbohydrate binding family 9 domain-containing protein, partial [Gemmatimonadetes bacterium]|nr:carbohydrate binding family 9 domain-containing protein [Gemmatimonadota bacterium]
MTVHTAAPRRAARLLAACAALAAGGGWAPALPRALPWALACLPLAALRTGLTAQQTPEGRAERPSIRAVRVGPNPQTGIRLDGLLDEPAWGEARPAGDFRQREPREGEPATEETQVWVLYDARTLYIGVSARDREPDALIARILQRDRVMQADFDGRPQFAGDDGVAIVFDPFHDHRNGVVFATNPNGAEFDALITDEGRQFNISWRGVWSVAARRTAEGWSAEFAIPFRTLRFAGGGEPWGLNVYRVIRRKNEEVLWTAWSRANEGLARLSRAGHLEGLEGLPRAGLGVEFKPYSLTGGTMEYDSAGGRSTSGALDAGLDLKYEVRPGLVLDATLNTDFAQVEVDDEQVNLTRFDLFFPEKRDFFLENAGIFEFGTRGVFEPPPFLLFFSRRVGIAADGVVPVLGGVRLTGRGLQSATIASASISTSRSGSTRPLTSTIVLAGRISRKNSPWALPTFSHSAM